jgi:hypothetical protein
MIKTDESEMGGTYGAHGEDEKCIKIRAGKPKGKRQLGRSRHRWKDIF